MFSSVATFTIRLRVEIYSYVDVDRIGKVKEKKQIELDMVMSLRTVSLYKLLNLIVSSTEMHMENTGPEGSVSSFIMGYKVI